MSALENELQEIEVTIEELKKAVELRDTVLRLHNNKDFQKIVEEGYFVQEASRILLLKGDPNLPADKAAFLEMDGYGPGAFKRYLYTAVQMGNQAEDQIQQEMATMDEINQAIAEGEE